MFKITNIILASSIVCFILSCGNSTKVVSNHFLTKRKYNKGWHVNNTSKKQENTKQKYTDTPIFPDDTLAFFEMAEEKEIPQELFASNELRPIVYKEYKKSVLQYTTAVSESDTNKVAKKKKRNNTIENKRAENEPPKTNFKALLSFVIVAIWCILGFLAYYASFMSAGFYFYLLILSLFVLAIPFLVLTTIAIIKWIKCKKCYKNNAFLIPGVLIMGILLLIGVFATLLYILNYSYYSYY